MANKELKALSERKGAPIKQLEEAAAKLFIAVDAKGFLPGESLVAMRALKPLNDLILLAASGGAIISVHDINDALERASKNIQYMSVPIPALRA